MTMMSMTPVVQNVPWIVAAVVMLGIALAGWRRTRATGALLIVISAALQIVDGVAGTCAMLSLMRRQYSYAAMANMYGLVSSGGHLITSVLFIVGVALLIKRLPTAQRLSR
jgi:hypothetical protein